MRKALIHDILVQSGGAEKCVESFTNIWDDFDIFTMVDNLSDQDRERMLKGKKTTTSFIQKLPFSKIKKEFSMNHLIIILFFILSVTMGGLYLKMITSS